MKKKRLKPQNKFGELDKKPTSYDDARAVILPVPYEVTTTWGKGTINGPKAIINASNYVESFDDELYQDTYDIVGIYTAKPLSFKGLGQKESIELVADSVGSILDDGKLPVVVGGEHSISAGCVKSFVGRYPDMSVLHLDAHYDLRDSYFGTKLNHGCAARRMSEYFPVVQAGVRSLSRGEYEFLGKTKNVRTFNVYDIIKNPDWINDCIETLGRDVYVSIDLDVFDPSIMPSVGTPEPGGLDWMQVIGLLNKLSKNRNVVGFDVVELLPIKGILGPDFMAAKLIYRFLGYISSKGEEKMIHA